MIYVFTYDSKIFDIKDVITLTLTSTTPLREVYKKIKTMNNNDIVIMFPKDMNNHPNYLSKIIPIYSDEYSVLSFSPEDPEKRMCCLSQDKFQSSDTIIFKKEHMRNGITDISSSSSYDKVREKIIRLCGGGSLYVPYDRRNIDIPSIVYANTTPSIDAIHSDNIKNIDIPSIVYANTTPSIDAIHSDNIKNHIYKVRLNLGIGDMIYARGILDSQRNNFSQVIISPNFESYIEARQPIESDISFTKELFKLLFNKPPYYIIDEPNKNYQARSASLFYYLDNIPLVKPDLRKEICEGNSLNIGPYIVIPTRVRGVSKKEYDMFIKKRLIRTISNLSKKYMIVLIGERNLIKYREQENLMKIDMIFDIYKDMKNAVDKKRLLDITFKDVNKIIINDDRMKKFKQECKYMKESECVITLGCGGPFCMATSVSNVIGYYTPNLSMDANVLVFKNKEYDGIHITDNIESFFNKMEDLLIDKPVLKIKIYLGLGDIIYTKMMLDKIKSNFSNIYISPDESLISNRDNKKEFYTFCKNMIKMLFDDPSYIITDDQSYKSLPPHKIYLDYKIKLEKPDLSSYLCDDNKLPDGLVENEYIVITTKVRALERSTYNRYVREGLWKSLKILSQRYKVVVMGEQKVGINPEYKNITHSTYSIYDNIIKNIGERNIIDLTVPELGITVPSIKKIKEDCNIMNKADHVVTIGIGGNFVLSTSVAKSTLCMREINESIIVETLYTGEHPKGVFTTNSVKIFNDKINDICKKRDSVRKEYKANLFLGIGTLIYIKAMLDNEKHKYNKIYVSPRQALLTVIHPGSKEWKDFTDSLIHLFFNEPPYEITNNQHYPPMDVPDAMRNGFPCVVPDLKEYLCKGTLPDGLIENEFIVMSTKVRWFYKNFYKKAINQGLWKHIADISNKYKLVIMGEREVGINKEYIRYQDHVYSIYNDIIKNIPRENIIDITIPEYGISSPSLSRLQNDCYIMSKSRCSITLGIGGNFCMSTAVSKTIGLDDPADPDPVVKALYIEKNPSDRIKISRNIDIFLKEIDNI